MKIILCGSEAYSVKMFRGDLVRDLVTQGHDVIIMVNNASEKHLREFSSLGASYINSPISRSSLNPLKDIKVFLNFFKVFMREQPDCVLSYTIKPVVWSGMVLRFFPKIRFIGMITGLGYAFNGQGRSRSLLSSIVKLLYKLALAKAYSVIFQNPDNKAIFIKLGIVDPRKAIVVNGSGVNLDHFSYHPYYADENRVSFLMIARLLKDKGILEFLSAARSLKSEYSDIDFILLGHEDKSENSVSMEEINELDRSGVISFHGFVDDVRNFLIGSAVYVLPSYHEGLPRSVLEAMAIGRPIITTNVPGCRETVVNGVNGWLVPKGDSDALIEKMRWFMGRRSEINKMGSSSREIAIKKFDVKEINKDILNLVTRP
ncbi:glycosyltransferase family 4 protein [Gammaproteobacteria bacterium]|nr:glycosyltransferase family 4 protein [Gammaproteobacteria bacterium]MDC1251201.1 glycosyltransferase family 4 protein [Gammaproteobacteria bacterium]